MVRAVRLPLPLHFVQGQGSADYLFSHYVILDAQSTEAMKERRWMVRAAGFEPATVCLRGNCSTN